MQLLLHKLHILTNTGNKIIYGESNNDIKEKWKFLLIGSRKKLEGVIARLARSGVRAVTSDPMFIHCGIRNAWAIPDSPTGKSRAPL